MYYLPTHLNNFGINLLFICFENCYQKIILHGSIQGRLCSCPWRNYVVQAYKRQWSHRIYQFSHNKVG